MNNHSHDTVTQVGCNVHNCTYNTPDHYCSAKRIAVENEQAMKKAETFCATFSTSGGMQG